MQTKKFRKFPLSLLLASGLMTGLLTACQNKMAEYYEQPEWLKGSLYEILEADGHYSAFLKGVDLCEYTSLLQGRSILTVMAPDDQAMKTYLTAHYGTDDISSLPVDEVKKLIGFHVLYYAFDSDKLENFRPSEGDGATEEQKEVNAGLYFKFRTRSQDAPGKAYPSRMETEAGIVDTTGVEVDEYHLERFLPVFSYKMFETKVIDPKYNYEYFFPETEWKGDDGFNVADAVVTQYATVAKNGYLYEIDRVIEPLETLHTVLQQSGQYTQYLRMYDKYYYYALDEELTQLYGGGSKNYYRGQYEKPNNSLTLPNIAQEWPVNDYAKVTALSSESNSLFAPTDAAFDEFYLSYWGDPLEETGYPKEVSYDSISADALAYLLSNSFCSGALVFPEEISRGQIENAYTKTVINFDVDEVPAENRKICVNGVLYGQSVLTPPAVFGSVTGPAYKYKPMSIFLKMLTASEMQSTLMSDAVQFIMLYPENAQFENNNVWYDETTDKLRSGIKGDEKSTNLGSSAQSKYVNAHIVSVDGRAERFPASGLHVYRTLSTDAKLYWYVKNGRITNSFRYNDLLQYAGHTDVTEDSVYTELQELTFRGESWSNGICYKYGFKNGERDESFLLEGSNDNYLIQKFVPTMYLHRNEETLFQGFIQVLMKAGLIDEEAQNMTYMTENCLMLVPTTQAVKQAIAAGRFPYLSLAAGTQPDDADFWSKVSAPEDGTAAQDSFQHYMFSYFMPESLSPEGDYPYYGWGIDTEADGGIPSITDQSGALPAYVSIYIYDKGDRLTAKVKGMDREVDFYDGYDYLPFVFNDGGVHFINGVFDDCWPHR